jgi:ABC-type molybdate transport system substrate-binding protein
VNRSLHMKLSLCVIAVLGTLSGCAQRSVSKATAYAPPVVVYGPCGLQEPLEALTQSFQAQHPEIRINLMLDNANILVRKITDLGQHPDVFISPRRNRTPATPHEAPDKREHGS